MKIQIRRYILGIHYFVLLNATLGERQAHDTSEHLIFPTLLIQYLEFKRNKNKYNFQYVAMHMVTSQILKSVNFTKTEKSRYLENETMFFLQIKKSAITHQGLFYSKKQFCSGGNHLYCWANGFSTTKYWLYIVLDI